MFQNKGFTVVELLIVIVVIAIVASITITSFKGVTNRAANVARSDYVRKAYDQLQTYLTYNGSTNLKASLPADTYVCLGTGYVDVDPGAGVACYYDNYNGTTTIYRSVSGFDAVLSNANTSVTGNFPKYAYKVPSEDFAQTAPLYYYSNNPNYVIDGKPGVYSSISYYLDGANVDCGVRPILTYVSTVGSVYNYTARSNAINSGYGEFEGAKYTTCEIYTEL